MAVPSSSLISTNWKPSLTTQADSTTRPPLGGIVCYMPRKSSSSAAEFLPASRNLKVLARASRDCHGCDLYKNATQTVFGEGDSKSRVMLVGEQPGDKEDLA